MKVVLGANHQFLYPQAMTNAQAHTQTLRSMAQIRSLAALDCWLWPERQRSSEEKRILRDSGKWINYNIGDRPMDEPCFPASPDPNRRMRALDLLRREVEFAMEAGARKIVLGSGPDVPAGREAAKERLSEVLLRLGAEIPPQVTLTLEPTDREIDKLFLFGPVEETAAFVHQLQAAGLANLGVLLDMGHVPLMGETLESAVTHAGDTLRHIHLGNCILKNPCNPLYGDKHVAWGAAESEYGEEDAVRFIHLLQAAGYFQGEDCTVSFEMRPIEGLGPEESLARFIAVWEKSRPAELASQ